MKPIRKTERSSSRTLETNRTNIDFLISLLFWSENQQLDQDSEQKGKNAQSLEGAI